MQPKSEQPIFPHSIPTPPEDYKGFQKWAVDVSSTINEINKQLFNLYNRHLSDALAHPSMWKANRTFRQSYRNDNHGDFVITFPISPTNPMYLITGETRQVNPPEGYKMLIATSDLTCDFSINGIGGLDSGSFAPYTLYYLYAVVSGPLQDQIGILASINDPSVGPAGYKYGQWMYQGAVASDYVKTYFNSFVASTGHFMSGNRLDLQQHTGTITRTAYTFPTLPVTAKFGYFAISVYGEKSQQGGIGGSNGNNTFTMQQYTFDDAVPNFTGPSLVPIQTPQTIYVETSTANVIVDMYLLGWKEDQTENP